MNGKTTLAAAALSALGLAGCATADGGGSMMMGRVSAPAASSESASVFTQPASSDKKGECWGVNACKGQGACGGDGHTCAGQNACKGKGWLSLTSGDCAGRNGKFKPG